jgi:hypothetical protein
LLSVYHVDDAGFLYENDGSVVSDLNSGQLSKRGDCEQNPLVNNITDKVR